MPDWKMDPNWFMVIITVWLFVTAVFQTNHQSKSYVAQTVLSFLNEYSNRDMRAALDSMNEFKWENEALVNELQQLYNSCQTKQAIDDELVALSWKYVSEFEPKVGDARSKISWFFNKAWRLYSYKLIDKRSLEAICGLDGARTFIDICCPLTLAIRLAKIHKGDGEGFLCDPSVMWYVEISEFIGKPDVAIAPRTRFEQQQEI